MYYAVYANEGTPGDSWMVRDYADTPNEAEEKRVDYADRFPNEVTAVVSMRDNSFPWSVRGSIFNDSRFEDASVYNPIHSNGAMRLAR